MVIQLFKLCTVPQQEKHWKEGTNYWCLQTQMFLLFAR